MRTGDAAAAVSAFLEPGQVNTGLMMLVATVMAGITMFGSGRIYNLPGAVHLTLFLGYAALIFD
ncbi:MAG: hypothetical protein V1792_03475 [Pseudomonadota bacterium]